MPSSMSFSEMSLSSVDGAEVEVGEVIEVSSILSGLRRVFSESADFRFELRVVVDDVREGVFAGLGGNFCTVREDDARESFVASTSVGSGF